MILRSPSVLRPARVRPFLLAALAATSLSGCEFTQSLFRGRSTIPEAPMHPYGGGPGPVVVKPPSIVAGGPGQMAHLPSLNAPPHGAEFLRTPAGRLVAVLPIEGAPQDRGYVIREALSGAMGLRVDEAAFATAQNPYRLEGRAFLEGGALLLEWRMMDSVGRTLDQAFERQAFTAPASADPWSALSDEALNALGRRSAARLARGLAAGGAPFPAPTAATLSAAPPMTAPAPMATPPANAPAFAFAPSPAPAAPARAAPSLAPPSSSVVSGAAAPIGPSFAPGPVFSSAPPAASGGFAPAPTSRPAASPPTTLGVAPAAQPPLMIGQTRPSAPPPAAATSAPNLAQAPLGGLQSAPPQPRPQPQPAPQQQPAAPAAPLTTAFGAQSPPAAAVAANAPIAFRGVFGAPGDGDRSLSAALRQLLGSSGERIVPEGTPGAMVLAGQVEKKPGSTGDVISITWRLEDAFGGGVGQVLQENEVPRGALDGAWGEDAGYAAEGALDGVKQLISAARRGPG